jgi:hypothetical protein
VRIRKTSTTHSECESTQSRVRTAVTKSFNIKGKEEREGNGKVGTLITYVMVMAVVKWSFMSKPGSAAAERRRWRMMGWVRTMDYRVSGVRGLAITHGRV